MKDFKKLLFLLLFILCFFSFPVTAFAAETEPTIIQEEENIKPFDTLPGYIRDYKNRNVKLVNLREEPSLSSNVITTLHVGDPITIVDQEGEWFEVKYEDISGFVFWKYVGFVEPEIVEDSDLIGNSIIHYTSNENRDFNISLACQTINSTILNPGDEFCWSSIVGNANEEKGYLPSTVIVGGKPVIGYGGGVCQVSTTIYNALFDTTISPKDVHGHSTGCAYAEKDATVAYGYKDFIFENTYDFPIRMELYSYKAIVFVNIYKAETE